jgi:hypothetical protein
MSVTTALSVVLRLPNATIASAQDKIRGREEMTFSITLLRRLHDHILHDQLKLHVSGG